MPEVTWALEVVEAVADGIDDMGVDSPSRYLARAALFASPLPEALALIERLILALGPSRSASERRLLSDAQDIAAGAAAFLARVRGS